MSIYYEDDESWRNEYNAPHPNDGAVQFFEKDELVRNEYNAPHPKDGLIEFWKDGMKVRTATPTQAQFSRFSSVTIHGLQSASSQKYNFANAIVDRWDAAQGRYRTRIIEGPYNGEKIAVRPECLMQNS